MKKLRIELQPWDYSCGDGCCSDSGLIIKVNGQTITEYGQTPENALLAVLTSLGCDVKIVGMDDHGVVIWEL